MPLISAMICPAVLSVLQDKSALLIYHIHSFMMTVLQNNIKDVLMTHT